MIQVGDTPSLQLSSEEKKVRKGKNTANLPYFRMHEFFEDERDSYSGLNGFLLE